MFEVQSNILVDLNSKPQPQLLMPIRLQPEIYQIDEPELVDDLLYRNQLAKSEQPNEYVDLIICGQQNIEDQIVDAKTKLILIKDDERTIYVDWIEWICNEYLFTAHTMEQAIHVFDSVLSIPDFDLSNLTLIASACILIGSKMDEVQTPAINDFVNLSQGSFTHDDLVKCELDILVAIGFDLNFPLSTTFINSFLTQLPLDEQFGTCCSMFLDAALYCSKLAFSRASHIALVSVILSKIVLDIRLPLTIVSRSLPIIETDELKKIAELMINTTQELSKSPKTAFYSKYDDFIYDQRIELQNLLQDLEDSAHGDSIDSIL